MAVLNYKTAEGFVSIDINNVNPSLNRDPLVIIQCDSAPTYDSETNSIIYYKDGVKKTTTDFFTLFYYQINGVTQQTVIVDGNPITVSAGTENLSNYVKVVTYENIPDVKQDGVVYFIVEE